MQQNSDIQKNEGAEVAGATTNRPEIDNPSAAPEPVVPPVNAGVLILQWLTYAFWGWTLLVFNLLIWTSAFYFIADKKEVASEMSDAIAYGLAGLVVLFVISIVCDFFYSRRESQIKRGASMVIMLVHAVIFALFAAGFIIAAVFALVSIILSYKGIGGQVAAIVSALIMATLYGATLLRVLQPKKLRGIVRIYWATIAAIMLLAIGVSIVGPITYAQVTKQDRLISEYLPSVANAVSNYVEDKQRLPASLSEVEGYIDAYDGDEVRHLLDQNLVRYTQKSAPAATPIPAPLSRTYDDSFLDEGEPVSRQFYYELCVTYKQKDPSTSQYPVYEKNALSEDMVSTRGHAAGDVCYPLRASVY